jgi:hypothetical protein
MMRRVLLLMSVVALIVVMVAMSVGPAFAARNSAGCKGDDVLFRYGGSGPGRIDENGDGYVCLTGNAEGKQAYDNRL